MLNAYWQLTTQWKLWPQAPFFDTWKCKRHIRHCFYDDLSWCTCQQGNVQHVRPTSLQGQTLKNHKKLLQAQCELLVKCFLIKSVRHGSQTTMHIRHGRSWGLSFFPKTKMKCASFWQRGTGMCVFHRKWGYTRLETNKQINALLSQASGHDWLQTENTSATEIRSRTKLSIKEVTCVWFKGMAIKWCLLQLVLWKYCFYALSFTSRK